MEKRIIILAILMVSLSGCNKVNDTVVQTEPASEDMESAAVQTELISEDMESEPDNTVFEFGASITDEDFEVMEGMQSLFVLAEKENGYMMGLTGEEDRGEGIVPQGIIIGEDNELDLLVESVVMGVDMRKMAVQILVDYQQVPFMVDGKIYDTYYIEAQENISVSKKIKLVTDIDRNVDHKITALLINDLQTHASDADTYVMATAATGDQLLMCDEKKNNLLRPDVEYEQVKQEYADDFFGIFLTLEENERKAIPGSVIYAKPGETVKVYCRLAEFSESDETLVFLNIGEKQAKVNGKDFLLFKQEEPYHELITALEMTAPMEEGKYEVSAWAVNNPYGEIGGPTAIQTLQGSPRFTLCVEK